MRQGYSVLQCNTDEFKSQRWLRSESATRRCNVWIPGPAHQPNDRVAKGGHPLRDVATAHLRPIFIEDDLADPMGLVLDAPVAPHERQSTFRIGTLWREACAPGHHLCTDLASFFRHALALHLKYVCQAGPITVAHQHGTGLQGALLEAPVPEIERFRRGARLTGQRGEGKNGLHIFQKLGLMVFDHQHLVAPRRHQLLGTLAWREPGIHCYPPSFQHHVAEQLQDDGDCIGLGCDGLLGEGEAQAMGKRGEQMSPRSPLLLAPTEGLAVNGDRVLEPRWCPLPPPPPLGPHTTLGLEPLPIHASEDRMQSGGTRRATGKAQRPPQRFPILPAPRCNGGIAPVATAHRATSQGENGCQWVPLATWGPEVWYLGQDVDQRTRLWYHRCSSIKAFWLM